MMKSMSFTTSYYNSKHRMILNAVNNQSELNLWPNYLASNY